MSKQGQTLKTIQGVSKAGYIISKISFVCSIVGVAGSAIGTIKSLSKLLFA